MNGCIEIESQMKNEKKKNKNKTNKKKGTTANTKSSSGTQKTFNNVHCLYHDANIINMGFATASL